MGQTRFGTGLVAGVLAGLLAGWMLGKLSPAGLRAPQPRPATEPERAQGVPSPPQTELSVAPGVEREARESEESVSSEIDETELIPEALRDYARAGLALGWSFERRDPMPTDKTEEGLITFEHDVLAAPERVGRALGVLANQADGAIQDFLAHDPIAVLDRLGAGDIGPRTEFVTDAAGFAQLFPASAGKAADGVANLADPDAALEDGSVLVFPAGVFRLRALMREKNPFPTDVTVRGAGMDATLLLIGSLATRGELRNFALKDCTVFTEDNYLFDLGHRPASVLFERVRAIGFDMGAGSSCLFGARALAVLARFSRFEGGYGRHPRYGTLFDVRSDSLLARFEACRIDEVALRLEWIRPGASVAFVNCTLTNILDRRLVNHPHPGVVFPGSTIEFFPDDQGEPPRKDLNEIFPDWEKRIEE